MEAVWPDSIVEENNLTQNVSKLRHVFGEKPGAYRYIATVPGRGYRFIATVRAVAESTTPEAAEPTANCAAPEAAAVAPAHRSWARPIAAVVLGLLFLISAILYVWDYGRSSRRNSPPPPADKSIAILPFTNLSNDPANAYFAEGVRDEILARLAKVSALKVISRTSTQNFQTSPKNVREVADQLGVRHVLEGSVQRSGEDVRVTVQLVHAASDTHLWADTYDRKLTDMFQVETDIAQRVAASLAATLTGSETRALQSQPTLNVEAHHAYLKGRFFWNKRSPEAFRQALGHFNQAIELDPAYAQAYAGLADACLFLASDDVTAQQQLVERARAALQKALELDETLAEAHASLGLKAMNFDWEWTTAEQEYRRAIELNPNYATAHHWLGEFIAGLGRFDEGLRIIQRARELDPLSIIINTDIAKVYMMGHRYDEAIAQFRKALEMDPGFDVAHGLLALTYSLKGEHEAAFAEFRQMKDFSRNPLFLSWLGNVYGAAGRNVEAEGILNQLRDLSPHTPVSPMSFALVYAGMGDKDKAFEWLERSFAERAPWAAITLKAIPHFDGLRSDRRCVELLAQVRL